MAKERKAHDVVLPEVRKPAGYGRLVAVLPFGESSRELWFQHDEDESILRVIQVDLSGECGKPLTITTRARRERALFKL